jgi:curli biogenesis system outer membrane secretion channel CsgG
MVRSTRTLIVLAAACVVLAAPAFLRAQSGSVQITASDAKVFLSPDASSAVISPVPVGATLEIVAKSGTWYQVRLPKDASGFDRLGFIQAAKVKELAASGRTATTARAADAEASPAMPRSSRPTAAVMNFEFGTVQQWWSGNWDIGKGISDMLVEELLQTGTVRLLERKQIEAVLGEQDLANSNRADVSAKDAAKLSKVLGAKVLITGSVTKFGSEERNVGGTAGSVAGHFFGGAGAKNTTATVALTVRAIDASTSEILASVKGEAKSSRKGLLLGTAIGGNSGSINMSSSDFRETILGEATEKAVTEVATKLSTALANVMR